MTKGQNRKEHSDRLVTAYRRMMERVRTAMAGAEKQAAPALNHLIETAQKKAVELGEVTQEEAEKIAGYLRRDMEDAAEFLAGSETQDLVDWLKFDIRLIEDRLLEMFMSVADKTKLELLALERRAGLAPEYHTGEITGIGSLACMECGQRVHFHGPGHIPPCPKCHATSFARAQ